MSYTIFDIANIIGGRAILPYPETVIENLLTDSRRITFLDTSLFFALKTKRRDGAVFIPDLYTNGIRNFVIQDEIHLQAYEDANYILVENTFEALQNLAAFHRNHFHYPVIGITGSNGKTIVKEWLYQLLSPDYSIVRSPRSYNSQLGVALSVWQMKQENKLAIFEAGISEKNEMDALEKMIHPNIGIFTNLGHAHDEGFENRIEKCREKMKLFSHSNQLICPYGIKEIIEKNKIPCRAKLFTWGREDQNDCCILDFEKKEQYTIIHLRSAHETFEVSIPFTDEASLQNSMHCICVMLVLKVPIDIIQQRILHITPVEMRLQMAEAIHGCTVINDSYSFDINSFEVALDFLKQQHQYTRQSVILSDFPVSSSDHLFKYAIKMLRVKNIYRVIVIGNKWKEFLSELQNNIEEVYHFPDTNAFLNGFIFHRFHDEAILVKGARIFEFEKIMAVLLKKVHQTVLEINLTALAHNLKIYQSTLKPGVKLMAMTKAFGYGSGDVEVASLLQFHNVDYIAVAYTDEGVDLRNAGIRIPIMVMNIEEDAFETLVQHQLEPEIFSRQILLAFLSFIRQQGIQQYPIHIKVDTGMHRLGFEMNDLDFLSDTFKNNTNFLVKSVFSHLAASEDVHEDAFTYHQASLFQNFCEAFKDFIPYPFIRHLSNTAAIFRHPSLQFDMVRLGIGLYGIDAAKNQQHMLQHVTTLKTTVAQVRKVKAGESIGYSRRGRFDSDRMIATIRIGYADGFSRKMGNGKGYVYIHQKRVPVVGNVCMDMAMIDVTEAWPVTAGDEVEIFGQNILVQELASWCDTISYEILTGISRRVKRVYLEE
ncbi:MAG: bifunctional UDP-N-acetylmuramoyl-tripeptide:D-alanyl-D-alanine ligase/alanine racemase [Bacteroidetes bacterium]|mgnify:CR=1 FL=1|nr:bifunctional UDP-N-acetylmuramoyl-tripeptide:D-alanyl-D-alanine ligase/alanine racemase [Bacteroidota bacterium]